MNWWPPRERRRDQARRMLNHAVYRHRNGGVKERRATGRRIECPGLERQSRLRFSRCSRSPDWLGDPFLAGPAAVGPVGDRVPLSAMARAWVGGRRTLRPSTMNTVTLLTNLVFLADYQFFHGTSALAWTCLIGVQLALGASLGWLATDRRQAGEPRIGTGIGHRADRVALADRQSHSAIPYRHSVGLFAGAAGVLCECEGGGRAYAGWRGSIRLACVAVVLCPYAMANGIIASLMAGMLVLALGRRRDPTSWRLPWRPSRLSPAFSGVGCCRSIIGAACVRFRICRPVAYPGSQPALARLARAFVWGAERRRFRRGWSVLCFGWSACCCVGRRWRDGILLDASTSSHFWHLPTFALGTAIMVASGRAGAGLGQALSATLCDLQSGLLDVAAGFALAARQGRGHRHCGRGGEGFWPW